MYNAERARKRAAGSSVQEKIVKTESSDSILYEKGTASVLVKNNDPNGAIPQVDMEQIGDALDVSAAEGKQLQIVSGYRGKKYSSAHKLYRAIDVHIDGYTTEQTAEALYRSGNFNRVSSYTGRYSQKWGRMSTAHADYKTTGEPGIIRRLGSSEEPILKVYCLLFLLLAFVCVASDSVDLESEVSVTETTNGQVVHFWLSGETAKAIYSEMAADPVYDECLGGHYKEQGDFHCFVLDTNQYGCNFGINLSKQTLRKTVVCD